MSEHLQNHLDRRAFLARMVTSAFALGVAGKMGLPAALAEPVRVYLDIAHGPDRTAYLVKFVVTATADKSGIKIGDIVYLDAKPLMVAEPAGSARS